MNDLERLDRVDELLSGALVAFSVHCQTTLAPTTDELAKHVGWLQIVDARDEVRTLRARFVSGAASLTD